MSKTTPELALVAAALSLCPTEAEFAAGYETPADCILATAWHDDGALGVVTIAAEKHRLDRAALIGAALARLHAEFEAGGAPADVPSRKAVLKRVRKLTGLADVDEDEAAGVLEKLANDAEAGADAAAAAGAAPEAPADAPPEIPAGGAAAPADDRGAAAQTGAPDPDAPPAEAAGEKSREQLLEEATAGLTPGNPDHWTGDGKPDVRILKQTKGLEDLTAAQRDGWWAARQGGGDD